MKSFFYFFDLNEVLIDRYPAKIAKTLAKKYNTNNFIFIYAEKYNNGIPKNIPKGSKYYFLPDLSLKKINNILAKFPPNSLTTIAQRIPDMLMLAIFNKKEIPTFIVQHGLWSDKLERIPLLILIKNKFSKFLKYISYSKKISILNNIPLGKTLNELYHFLIKEDINIPETNYLISKDLRAKTAFVFDKSWDDYYVIKYGYDKKDLIYIGNPDFLILKEKIGVTKENAVCYICQTLVEDGRYLPADFRSFLEILKKHVTPYKKLYIKLHPRSRMENYKILEDVENVIFTNSFPICTHYIGHYSAMLAIARQTSKNVLIWQLKDHHMPEYFYQFASCVTSNEKDINNFIKNKPCNKKLKDNYQELSIDELKTFDPISVIADNIFNKIKNE